MDERTLEDLVERAEVEPLVTALYAQELEWGGEQSVAAVIIQALARLGDPRAIPALVATLEASVGVDIVPDECCHALAKLGAADAVPVLERMLRDAAGPAEALTDAVVTLAGVRAGPLFAELLDSADELVQECAVSALGRLAYLPAAPAVERLLGVHELRFATLGALVAMRAPAAEPALRAAIERAGDYGDRNAVIRIARRHQVTAIGPVLVEKATAWAEHDEVMLNALEAAGELGAAAAAPRLRELAAHAAQSPCTRARAAAILLALDHADVLPACLAFLRSNGGHAEKDPRDPFGRANETQIGVVSALEGYATRHPDAAPTVIEVLEAVQRATPGNPMPVGRRAANALTILTP
jgi:HEAT repeat protein